MNFFPFRDWFVLKPLSAGDWSFLFRETIDGFVWPFSPRLGSYPPLDFFFQATAKILSSFSFSWPLIERLVWFWPFLILTVFSSWYLAGLFFKSKIFKFLSSLVFLLNTYILMVVGGGQMGVAMGYALAPLVLGMFINIIKKLKSSRVKELKNPLINNSLIKNCLIPGFILGFQVMFDPRIALMTLGAVALYLIYSLKDTSEVERKGKLIITSVAIALLLHSFWLLPTILSKSSVLPIGYGGAGWVEFLSFADFPHTLSLLHPNWPENIFGKTYFMRSEFISIPLMAFSSLLFLPSLNSRMKTNKKRILANERIGVLFFASLALIGAFLAKGSNSPFGGIYLWLFNHFPGMNLFRDSTKFYALVALSYSVLIPFSVAGIYDRLRARRETQDVRRYLKIQKYFPEIFLLLVTCYLLLLVKPAILGQLGGAFKAKEVPQEYIVLKDFLVGQEEFFRTLWLPQKQRFGFTNNDHPAMESSKLASKEKLVTEKVKYVIIPYDSEGEIFLKDRGYDYRQRLALEEMLDEVSWLKKLDLTEKISVYQLIR